MDSKELPSCRTGVSGIKLIRVKLFFYSDQPVMGCKPA